MAEARPVAGEGLPIELHATVHMNAEEHMLVTDAVASAEESTSGEIVTIVAQQSDHYRDMANMWATIVAFLALAVYALFPAFYLNLIQQLLGGWELEFSAGEYVAMIFFAMALKWAGMRLLMEWRPLRFLLIPKYVKERRVRERAIELFKVGTQARTKGRSGVLIYLSMLEHRAEIVADRAISDIVAPETWGDAMAALLRGVRAGNAGKGMAEAVKLVGTVLNEHFPPDPENPNELPDRLIEI